MWFTIVGLQKRDNSTHSLASDMGGIVGNFLGNTTRWKIIIIFVIINRSEIV